MTEIVLWPPPEAHPMCCGCSLCVLVATAAPKHFYGGDADHATPTPRGTDAAGWPLRDGPEGA